MLITFGGQRVVTNELYPEKFADSESLKVSNIVTVDQSRHFIMREQFCKFGLALAIPTECCS